jgi:flagellin
MSLSIYSNMASSDAQLRLGVAQNAVNNDMAQLSSGLRIASIADDPSGMGIATQFSTQVQSYNTAAQNTNDGISLLQTADGAMSQTESSLQRMRQLALQSANGTLTTTERTNLQSEFSQLQSEIDRIAGSTQFGNVNLMNAPTTLTMQVGVNNAAADQISFTVPEMDTSAAGLNVASINVNTQTGSTAALNAIDTAIQSVSQTRATLGATQNRFSVALSNDQSFASNLGDALSRIQDVDVASASADLARNQVLVQAGIAVLAQANQNPNQALSLLPH